MNITTDNIVTLTTCIISAIVAYTISKNSIRNPKHYELLEKQLYNIYLPLFKSLEENLYTKIDFDLATTYINTFKSIKSSNYEIIDSNLCNLFSIFERSSSEQSVNLNIYFEICTRVSYLFDKTRKKLNMPTRSLYYKINNRQFPPDFRTNINVLLTLSRDFLFIVFTASLVAVFIQFLSNVASLILQLISQLLH